jgi:hypothetical protein
VSPQFHVVVDYFFETLRESAGNVVPISNWQKATGFVRSRQQQCTNKSMNPLAPRNKADRNKAENEHDEQVEIVTYDNEIADEHDGQTEQQPTDEPATSARAENKGAVNDDAIQTKSGRVSRPTERMLESIQQQMDGVVSLFVEWEVYHDDSCTIQTEMENPMAFAASSNPDVMYLDQAMKEPDRDKFEEAMLQEVQSHTDNGHWKIVPTKSVPRGTKIFVKRI